MRSVLCLFSIVADAEVLHRKKKEKKNCFNVQVWWTWIANAFCEWKKNVLIYDMTRRTSFTTSTRNRLRNRLFRVRWRSQPICRCKSIFETERILRISLKTSQKKLEREEISEKMRQCLVWNGKFFQTINNISILSTLAAREKMWKIFHRFEERKNFFIVVILINWLQLLLRVDEQIPTVKWSKRLINYCKNFLHLLCTFAFGNFAALHH